MNISIVKIGEVKPNPTNPRVIKDDKFKKLVKSIQEFPQMLQLRPIVVNDEMIVLGGNMRLRACKEARLKEVPIIKASDLTEQQQKEFIIKDNVGFGEWDWDALANEWDENDIAESIEGAKIQFVMVEPYVSKTKPIKTAKASEDVQFFSDYNYVIKIG